MVNINYKDVYIKDFYSIAGPQENNGNLKNVNRYLKDYYDGEKTIEEKGWEIFNLILDIASDRKKTCADKHKIYNALAVFNPAPVT